jgi:hypothetical protein
MYKRTGAGGEIYDDNYMNQPLEKSYDIDIVDKMTQMLADELTKSINNQILRGLGLEPDKFKRRKKKIENILKSFE